MIIITTIKHKNKKVLVDPIFIFRHISYYLSTKFSLQPAIGGSEASGALLLLQFWLKWKLALLRTTPEFSVHSVLPLP